MTSTNDNDDDAMYFMGPADDSGVYDIPDDTLDHTDMNGFADMDTEDMAFMMNHHHHDQDESNHDKNAENEEDHGTGSRISGLFFGRSPNNSNDHSQGHQDHSNEFQHDESNEPESKEFDGNPPYEEHRADNADQAQQGSELQQGSHQEAVASTDAVESEYDTIVSEIAETLDGKLSETRSWTKKLLHEITIYAKTMQEVQAEYARIQQLEHQESDRLDEVEPEVHDATSHFQNMNLTALLGVGHMMGGMGRGIESFNSRLGHNKRKIEQP